MEIIGRIIQIVFGLLLFIFWLIALMDWLGTFFGLVVGFLISPGLILFPIIYWIVEGTFPFTYFILWGLCILGAIIAGITKK